MRRHFLTLIEIMIVIVIIGLIGSVVAYNMRGSLEEGKAFRTQQGGAQIYNILNLEVARGRDIEEVCRNWQSYVHSSGMARKPTELIYDGWGRLYEVFSENDEILVHSERYDTYAQKHQRSVPVYFE